MNGGSGSGIESDKSVVFNLDRKIEAKVFLACGASGGVGRDDEDFVLSLGGVAVSDFPWAPLRGAGILGCQIEKKVEIPDFCLDLFCGLAGWLRGQCMILPVDVEIDSGSGEKQYEFFNQRPVIVAVAQKSSFDAQHFSGCRAIISRVCCFFGQERRVVSGKCGKIDWVGHATCGSAVNSGIE